MALPRVKEEVWDAIEHFSQDPGQLVEMRKTLREENPVVLVYIESMVTVCAEKHGTDLAQELLMDLMLVYKMLSIQDESDWLQRTMG